MSMKGQMLLQAMMFGLINEHPRGNVRVVDDASTEELKNEYNLIQEKKSQLSRSQRERVVQRYNYYVKIGKL